jgi:hypothetical protein
MKTLLTIVLALFLMAVPSFAQEEEDSSYIYSLPGATYCSNNVPYCNPYCETYSDGWDKDREYCVKKREVACGEAPYCWTQSCCSGRCDPKVWTRTIYP